MSKEEILEFFDDINYAYNDCGKRDSLSYRLNEFEQEVRNKAIYEFAERLSLEISESIIWDMLVNCDKDKDFNETSDKIVDYVIDTAKKIADEMRGGGMRTENDKICSAAYFLTQTMNEKELLKLCIVLLKGILGGWK